MSYPVREAYEGSETSEVKTILPESPQSMPQKGRIVANPS